MYIEEYACHVLLFSHDVPMLSVVEPHVRCSASTQY